MKLRIPPKAIQYNRAKKNYVALSIVVALFLLVLQLDFFQKNSLKMRVSSLLFHSHN